jgi:hypothetical protein
MDALLWRLWWLWRCLLLQLDLDASSRIILLLLASKEEEEGQEEVLLSFSFFPFCPDQVALAPAAA